MYHNDRRQSAVFPHHLAVFLAELYFGKYGKVEIGTKFYQGRYTRW